MPTFKLTIAYDGTGFVGWQRQAAGASIQGLLEDAFAALDGREVAVTGAGRTDAGVHAVGQVAGVTLARTIDASSLVRAINVRLPEAVRVTAAEEMPEAFHARFDARSKTYRYRIWNGPVSSPFERAFAWHVPLPLDVAAMDQAAALLEGRHDFSAFQGGGAETHDTERMLFRSRVTSGPPAIQPAPAPGSMLITYEVRGSGFLRHMVRNIVGTLVELGRGRHPASWMSEVLASRRRANAGPTAPAEGLCLVGVDYDYNVNLPRKHPHVA